ncbi:MAG: Small subunit (SSU) processome component [Claussenomyces sp. TS43310]|nr:MAG: Small subunit (SSU) processome component [Claussenomyces sp. TS43310]
MSTKRKLPTKLGQPVVRQSAKPLNKEALDDSATVVAGGGLPEPLPVNGIIKPTIDNGDEEDGDDESDSGEEPPVEHGERRRENASEEQAAAEKEDAEMHDLNAPLLKKDEAGEPSFGELVRASASEPIDVAAAFDDSPAAAPRNARLSLPSGTSLSTVLTQALKTNDKTLMESCLQATDVQTIRLTIQRLSSPLAGTLLSQLAERLHRRPGRSASIMIWVQWTLVMHGGYLATQADLVQQLAALNKVIDQRARGLQGLLALKGKLDMLEAQGQLRRSMQNTRWGVDADAEDEEAALYIEGEEEDSEADDIDAVQVNGVKHDQDIESEDENMPATMNDQEHASSADDDEDDDSDADNVIDDEASESENDGVDEDEVDYDDVDSVDDDDESDDAAPARGPPPSKVQKKGGPFSKVR